MYFNVSSINFKENKRNLEIPRISFSCCLYCLYDCRTIELSDYRAVVLALGSQLEELLLKNFYCIKSMNLRTVLENSKHAHFICHLINSYFFLHQKYVNIHYLVGNCMLSPNLCSPLESRKRISHLICLFLP